MHSQKLLAGLMLAAASASTWAFQPLITDDTGTQGQGGNQLEISANRDRAEAAGITDTAHTLPFTYTRGLTDTLDAFVSVSHIRLSSTLPGGDASGSGNPSLGVKWRFYENEASKISMALKPELRLPVSDADEARGLGTGRTSFGATLILTQETHFGAVHANLAVSRNRFRDALANPDSTSTRLSVTPVWDVNEQWKLAVDLGTESENGGGVYKRAHFFEIGAIYSPSKTLDFAFGVIRRTLDDAADTTVHSLTAGVTWRFK